MEKDYKEWHDKKTFINNEKERPFFHEREVWSCVLGDNVGFEQDGRGENFMRPVLILKKFSNEVLWGIPLTKTIKENKYHYNFFFDTKEQSSVILSQLRLIDSKRLAYKMGDLLEVNFLEIRKRIIHFLE